MKKLIYSIFAIAVVAMTCACEKNGYEKSGIRKEFYSKPKEDALIMWKYFQ